MIKHCALHQIQPGTREMHKMSNSLLVSVAIEYFPRISTILCINKIHDFFMTTFLSNKRWVIIHRNGISLSLWSLLCGVLVSKLMIHLLYWQFKLVFLVICRVALCIPSECAIQFTVQNSNEHDLHNWPWTVKLLIAQFRSL